MNKNHRVPGADGIERPAITTLRVRILGPLQVEGVDPSLLGSRKQRSLLRVLAVGRGAPVSVDRLIECLWPNLVPARPADQVGVLVSRIRSVLGATRVTRGDAGYSLVADWLDLVALDQLTGEAERRLSEGQPAAAATAAAAGLALAAGPLLADEQDAPWADEARIAVDRTLARLRRIAAEACIDTGDPFGAASAAQAALDQDPYDEHALRLLMIAHARAGRSASALAAYARTRELLIDSLGASPSQLTEALHLAVLRDEIATDVAPLEPHRKGSGLAGRDEPWRALDEALSRAKDRVELIVIEGDAGIGKTTLLDAWSKSIESAVTVLRGVCAPIGALPLQPLLDAIEEHLGRLDEAELDALTDSAGPVLGPLLRGQTGSAAAHDPLTAQAALFAGALHLCNSASRGRQCVVVLDDVHLADDTTLAWLSFVARRPAAGSLLVVMARRPDRPFPISGTTRVALGPLDVAAAAVIVGDERAAELVERTGGNPLFLVELADFEGDELPASILESVAARCAQAGRAELTLRTAAVLGAEVDLDLLAAVLQQSAVTLLGDLEVGERLMILEERGTTFCFRHALVREALVAGTNASRRALAHRDAARLLAARPRFDPLTVAMHARQGGDLELAASSLVLAGNLTASRFDHAGAERLLDESLELSPSLAGYLARGQVRLTIGDFSGAATDARRALALAAPGDAAIAGALELASWSAYYQRDFATARSLCQRASEELAGPDRALRRSVAALAGRIAHADGELDLAQQSLELAVDSGRAPGPGRAGVAGVWLGWLLADRGEPERAQRLAEEAELDGSLSAHPFATAHRALLASYSIALRGRSAEALTMLDAVDHEVELRGLDHFGGRTANYRAWLLRNLLFSEAADELNLAAAEVARARELREPQAQSALDLADSRLRSGDLAAAADALELAESFGAGFAFSWKASLRHQLLIARLMLDDGRPAEAEAVAEAVVARARELGTLRYATIASSIVLRARVAGGASFDAVGADRVLEDVDRFAPPESWWITAELAHDLGIDRWWVLAEQRVEQTAIGAGAHATEFRQRARTWLDRTRSRRRRS